MWPFLLDLLFPRKSLGGRKGSWVTPEELSQLTFQPIAYARAALRARGILELDALVAAGEYGASPLLRMLIHRFKFERVTDLEPVLGKLLLRAAGLLALPSDAVLCPVPLHWTREYQRGFNQSRRLADFLARERGWQVQELLMRVRRTGYQSHHPKEDRHGAVANAFALCAGHPLPPAVILVDDVCTTGATLDACAHVLRAAGVRRVEGLVVAVG